MCLNNQVHVDGVPSHKGERSRQVLGEEAYPSDREKKRSKICKEPVTTHRRAHNRRKACEGRRIKKEDRKAEWRNFQAVCDREFISSNLYDTGHWCQTQVQELREL